MAAAASPTLATSSLLNAIRTQPRLPTHTWYFIAGVTLSALNRPDELPKVFEHAIEHGAGPQSRKPGEEGQLAIARRLREGLVKSAAVVGLPKVTQGHLFCVGLPPALSVLTNFAQTINALLSLKSVTPPQLVDAPLSVSPTHRPIELFDTPTSQILARGERFFNGVYGKISQRVMGQMDRCGTEDLGLVARLMYGYLLSNTSVLNACDSSFVLLAGLIPQDVNPQLKGHLKGAINNGATLEEVVAVREICMKICIAAGMKTLPDGERDFGWTQEVANL